MALFFEARLGELFLEGVDHLRFDAGGLVSELRGMMRPMSAMQRLVVLAGARRSD